MGRLVGAASCWASLAAAMMRPSSSSKPSGEAPRRWMVCTPSTAHTDSIRARVQPAACSPCGAETLKLPEGGALPDSTAATGSSPLWKSPTTSVTGQMMFFLLPQSPRTKQPAWMVAGCPRVASG